MTKNLVVSYGMYTARNHKAYTVTAYTETVIRRKIVENQLFDRTLQWNETRMKEVVSA